MKRILLLAATLLWASPALAFVPAECSGFKQSTPYAECIIQYENAHTRPTHPFPDLLDRLHQTRRDLAARLDNGEITRIEARAELEQVTQRVVAEGMRRLNRQRYNATVGRILDAEIERQSRRTDCIGIDLGGGFSTLTCD